MPEMVNEYKVLDHGYVKLVTWWGTDARIVEAARMSTQKGFEGWGPNSCPECEGRGFYIDAADFKSHTQQCEKCKGTGQVPGDERLLRYLYSHNHLTPFEMAGMQIEVQAPIFVFREWHRHRTQSYNEMSARYAPLPNQNYIPTLERTWHIDERNKQAGRVVGSGKLSEDDAAHWRDALEEFYTDAERLYQAGLAKGVPKELARLVLPVGRYSRMRAQATLRNWLQFLSLRDHPAAQWEIQQYAQAVSSLVKDLFPRTYELFAEKR